MPTLWHAPATDMRLKPRSARIVIHEIIADVGEIIAGVDNDSRTIVLEILGRAAVARRLRVRELRS